MTPHCFDRPDDPRELAAWLERHLVGLSLGELIAEWSAAHAEDEPRTQTLADLLGDDLPAVLDRGLSVLAESKLRSLIRWPWVLRELQHRVLVDGGEYWRSLPAAPSLDVERQRVWSRIRATIAPNEPSSLSQQTDAPSRRSRRRIWALVAAMLLIGLGIWRALPTSPAWGWNRPGVFADNVRADDYLRRLADAAEEYFSQPRDSAKQLDQTLADFRRACDVLLAANHEPLSDDDRTWLRERCQTWSKKFDDQLAELHRSGDAATVRAAADETVKKLVLALRNHIANPQAGTRRSVREDFHVPFVILTEVSVNDHRPQLALNTVCSGDVPCCGQNARTHGVVW